MLLAEELALVALKPESGRLQLGTGDALNACLAGLLIAELLIDGSIGPGDWDDLVVAVPGRQVPGPPALAAALEVITEKGPKIKGVLSHMSRGIEQRTLEAAATAAIGGAAAAGS